jgi:hypothetical protein
MATTAVTPTESRAQPAETSNQLELGNENKIIHKAPSNSSTACSQLKLTATLLALFVRPNSPLLPPNP